MSEENVVFIFGAGASKAENAPITSELLSESLKKMANTERLRDIKKFLKEFYYLEDFKNKDIIPTFEEVLTTIDICISHKDDLSYKWDLNKVAHLRNSLLYCIAKILDINLQSSGKIHREFIDNLFNLSHRNNKNTHFISLNYDLLLDNSLIELYEKKDWDVDYGIDFQNFIEPMERTTEQRSEFIEIPDDWSQPRKNRSVYLLKPHGSLNWLYCPNCNTIHITKKEKGILRIWTDNVICEKDESLQTPLLIPPTWHKIYENAHLVRIWQKTKEILTKSDKAYFIGYSLPESDTELKYLFKKFLYHGSKRIPEITVVTRKSENTKYTEQRFKRTFGKDVKMITTGFEDFAKNLSNHINS